MEKQNIGLIGLAVMGENLVLNMESKGFSVAVYNRTISKVDNFISGRANLYPVVKRLEGYTRALNDNGLEVHEELICSSSPALDDAYQSVIKLMDLPNPPTALLISGTIITLGVLKAIIGKKKSVPKDFSIIGFSATTTTSPKVFITSINARIPGAVIPSSFMTKIRGFFCIFLKNYPLE